MRKRGDSGEKAEEIHADTIQGDGFRVRQSRRRLRRSLRRVSQAYQGYMVRQAVSAYRLAGADYT